MENRITNAQAQNFLRDFKNYSEVIILEKGSKEVNELLQSARKRGIIIAKDDIDLGIIKSIYAFAEKPNSNGVRLPVEEFKKALPGIVGRPMNYAHDRKKILGFYIDYKYILKEDKAITYSVFFKSAYPKLWEKAKDFQKKKKLSSSFEIWSPNDKNEYLKDGTYYLHKLLMAGGALIFEEYGEEPAFKDAKVLSISSKEIEECIDGKCLVCAKKYKETEILTADTNIFEDSVKENYKKFTEEKKVQAQPKKVEPILEEKKIEPQTNKIKCSNCGEEIEHNGIDVQVKCPKCFAILNKEGVMQYPPQIKDFKVLCPSCKIGNWLILSKSDEKAKLKCLSCAKEYEITFAKEDKTDSVLSKFRFVYIGSTTCHQCGKQIDISGVSDITTRKIKCPKCGLQFDYDIAKAKKYKKISEMKEIEFTPQENKLEKSSKGGKKMEFKLEISKYHRYVDDYDKIEATLSDGYIESPEIAKKITIEERKALSDKMFAVVMRVKDKKTNKIKKIRTLLINDEANIKNALIQLEQPKSKAILSELGVSIDTVKNKISARAKQLESAKLPKEVTDCVKKKTKAGMKPADAVKKCWAEYKKTKAKKPETSSFKCSCVKCGHKITSDKHCVNLKCPKCGGQMRRTDRPGDGKPEEKKAKEQKTAKATPKVKAPKIEDKVIKPKLDTAKDNKFKDGLKKLVNQIKSLKKELADTKADMEKKVEFYKTNAEEINKRKETLGDFSEKLTDEEILVDEKFAEAQAEKENALIKSANIVGDKVKGNDYLSGIREEVDNLAFGRKKKK